MTQQEITQMQAEIAKLKAQNEALKKQAQDKLKVSIGQSGTIQVMGLRRFPVSFYSDEWEKLLGLADQIRSFAKTHEAELKAKNEQAKLAKLQPVKAA